MVLPALQVRVPNPANALLQAEQIKGVRAESQERARQAQVRNALVSAFQGGIPTDPVAQNALVNQVAAIDPQTAFGIQANFRAANAPPPGFTLSPGAARFDAAGNVVAERPTASPALTQAMRNFQFAQQNPGFAQFLSGGGQGFTLTPGQTRFNALGQQIASLPTEQTNDPVVANQLRDEFVSQTNEFADVQNAFRKVEAAAATDSGPGDIALLVGYMKIIDPGSVVREGEFATAETAGGVGEDVRNLYNRIVSGERLTPQLRQRFVQAAGAQFQTYTAGYDQTVQTYNGLAQRFGLDPATVVFNRVVGGASEPETETISPTAAPSTRAGEPRADISSMTADQIDALDPLTMTPAELFAAEQRRLELQNAR